MNEIMLAKDAGAIIIPFKIENILPEGEMKYYLRRTQWLDAMDTPAEKHIQLLVETINDLTKVSTREEQEKLRREEERKDIEQQERSNREHEEGFKLKEKQREKEEKDRQHKGEEEPEKPESIPKTYTSSIGMKFILIPEGEFIMGSEEHASEKPLHKVLINRPFYLGTWNISCNAERMEVFNGERSLKLQR